MRADSQYHFPFLPFTSRAVGLTSPFLFSPLRAWGQHEALEGTKKKSIRVLGNITCIYPGKGKLKKKAHLEPNETGAAMYLPSSLALAGGAAISQLGNLFLHLVFFFFHKSG